MKLKVDILGMEIKGELPHWLSPSERHDPNSDKAKAIRDKHRAKWLAEQDAKRQAEKDKT